jgi:uncharacterized membrane protein YphA (DoxX/SURF4 family)
MNPNPPASPAAKERALDGVAVGVRFALGALFVAMGLQKAMHPVEFLKQIRAYQLADISWALNFLAITLPWVEAFCGLLLVLGIAVRGTAVLMAGMLAPFTLAVLWRAWGIYGAGGVPFCSIKFDCGCGAGEVYICAKVVENAALLGGAIYLAARRHHRFGIWPAL